MHEVFGAITVDRVAVRPDATPAQAKVRHDLYARLCADMGARRSVGVQTSPNAARSLATVHSCLPYVVVACCCENTSQHGRMFSYVFWLRLVLVGAMYVLRAELSHEEQHTCT